MLEKSLLKTIMATGVLILFACVQITMILMSLVAGVIIPFLTNFKNRSYAVASICLGGITSGIGYTMWYIALTGPFSTQRGPVFVVPLKIEFSLAL